MTLAAPLGLNQTVLISAFVHAGFFALVAFGPARRMNEVPLEISFINKGAVASSASASEPAMQQPPRIKAPTAIRKEPRTMKPRESAPTPAPVAPTANEVVDASENTASESSPSASFGAQGAVVNSYAADVTRMLNAQKTYPDIARRMRQQGRVRLQFTLNRDGTVLAVDVLENSPHQILNEAARSLVERIHQFKPFPNDVKAAKMVFTVPLEYTM